MLIYILLLHFAATMPSGQMFVLMFIRLISKCNCKLLHDISYFLKFFLIYFVRRIKQINANDGGDCVSMIGVLMN